MNQSKSFVSGNGVVAWRLMKANSLFAHLSASRTRSYSLYSFFSLLVLLSAGVVVERIIAFRMEERLAQNALDIAYSVSQIPMIQANLGVQGGHHIIQPIAEAVRASTSAEFVVAIDMDSIRYSHPVAERIGEKFVGGDEGPALRGEVYTSKSVGTLGPSLRAFVPVYRGAEQVGVISVGILINDIQSIIQNIRLWIYLAFLGSLFLGLIGSNFLAINIKKAMFGLEPFEISKLLNERDAVLESVKEGILAVDGHGRLVLINSEARRLLGWKKTVKKQDKILQLPGFRLREALLKGEPVYDQEHNIQMTQIMSNTIPIKDKEGKVSGAIISFRDMTEIRKVAQEFMGVMRFIDTLRAQNHEYLNKLHTISGLIQLGEQQKALDFISKSSRSQRTFISFISERIKDPTVAAVLLGKMGRARELGIKLRIDPESSLGELKHLEGTTLVTIIGNLVDNAMEAVLKDPAGRKEIELSILDEFDGITITVKDSGPGIPLELKDRIFERGFTTGGESNRGLGLYIIKSLLDSLNGEIDLESNEKGSTEFSVYIPNKEGED
jgi:sensor histidine kinase regulating citrate/malate metabolism